MYTDSIKLHQYAVYVRKFYQALITCVMKIDKNFINNENENRKQHENQFTQILKSENISKHEIELTQAVISVQQRTTLSGIF